MNLAVVNEAVTEMNGVEHQFTEEEKNFVVQFAFRSGSKEDTISLIEALAHSADKAESDEIMVTYRSKYDMNTVKAVAIALGIYAMAIVMYYTSQRNYMPGKEFGTARFENPKQVNKILADKDENFNRILSQNVKMSLDFRRLKLNGNILICGGSGAGKTFYEVKPNLMQMPHNCSFICTDPKGEILRSCGQMLKNNGSGNGRNYK